MTGLQFIFSLILLGVSAAADLPWMGVFLEPLQAKDRLKSELGKGVGLKVQKVVSGGPLAVAGGRAGDLWWKIDNQLLLSKQQMLNLLRQKTPGDSVTIQFYRQGVFHSLALALGEGHSPKNQSNPPRPIDPDSARILAKREQIARVTSDGQTLSLQREGDDWRFEVHEMDKAKLSVLVNESNFGEMLPSRFHSPFLILRLTLEKQRMGPNKKQGRRVRYILRDKTPEE